MTDAIAAAAIMLPLLAIGTALLATGRRHDRIVAAAAEAERLILPTCTVCRNRPLRTDRQRQRRTCDACDDAHAEQNIVEWRW